MRFSIVIALILSAVICAGPASADRLILAPTGNVLRSGEIRAEGAISSSDSDGKIYWLALGLQRLEVNAARFDGGADVVGASGSDVFGAELSVLPETTLTPGIGVGVWDMTNETADGRGYYLALSKGVPLTKQLPLPIRDIRLHVGYGIEGIDGLFAGADAKIPLGFRLYAEFFKDDFNYALGWTVLPGLQVKLSVIDGDAYYGAQLSPPVRF